MSNLQTTEMVNQMNRYFNAIKEKAVGTKLIVDTLFGLNVNENEWTWDLRKYQTNYELYDFLTVRLNVFLTNNEDLAWSPEYNAVNETVFKYTITDEGILTVRKVGNVEGVKNPYRLQVYQPIKKYKPILPPVTETIFHGEVDGATLITMSELAEYVGVTQGSGFNLDSPWLHFTYNDKELYIAKKPIHYDLTWEHLNLLNAVTGDRTIFIDGKHYKIRLLEGTWTNVADTVNGYDPIATHGSEWNRLMYRIHSGVFTDPKNTMASEGLLAGDLAQYSDEDLGLGSEGALNYGCNSLTLSATLSGNVIGRGLYGISYVNTQTQSDLLPSNGWRPVLELTDPPSAGIVYEGEVLGSQLISMSNLTTLVGMNTVGTAINQDSTWLKYVIKGKSHYVAKKPIRLNVSWDNLNNKNIVNGSKLIEIGDGLYRIRLLKGTAQNPAQNVVTGYDSPFTYTSEWNQLLYHVHNGNYYGGNTLASEGISVGDWAQFSDGDLGLGNPLPRWSTLTTVVPKRLNAYCAVVDNKIYLIGGTSRTDFWEIDPADNSQESITSLANGRDSRGIHGHDGFLYVYDGVSVSKYDPVSKLWTYGVDAPFAAVKSPITFIYDNHFYVYGGYRTNGTVNTEMWRYDLTGDRWLVVYQTNTGPVNIRDYQGILLGYKVFVQGGIVAGKTTGNMYSYNLVTNTWSTVAEGPSRYRHSLVIKNDRIYLYGGKSIVDTVTSYHNEVWIYRPISNDWVNADSDSAGKRAEQTCCVVDNKMYVLGGVLESNDLADSGFNSWAIFQEYDYYNNICLELVKFDSSRCIVRGNDGISSNTSIPTNITADCVWRPLLEYVGPVAAVFKGEVTANQLVSMTDLTTMLGVTTGTPINLQSSWLHFEYKGNDIYVAKKPIRKNVNWQHLSDRNAVDGSNEITVDGNRYSVRLIGGVNGTNLPNSVGYDTLPTHGSEWNRLMYHIHSGVFEDPNNTLSSEGLITGDLAQYSDEDLGINLGYQTVYSQTFDRGNYGKGATGVTLNGKLITQCVIKGFVEYDPDNGQFKEIPNTAPFASVPYTLTDNGTTVFATVNRYLPLSRRNSYLQGIYTYNPTSSTIGTFSDKLPIPNSLAVQGVLPEANIICNISGTCVIGNDIYYVLTYAIHQGGGGVNTDEWTGKYYLIKNNLSTGELTIVKELNLGTPEVKTFTVDGNIVEIDGQAGEDFDVINGTYYVFGQLVFCNNALYVNYQRADGIGQVADVLNLTNLDDFGLLQIDPVSGTETRRVSPMARTGGKPQFWDLFPVKYCRLAAFDNDLYFIKYTFSIGDDGEEYPAGAYFKYNTLDRTVTRVMENNTGGGATITAESPLVFNKEYMVFYADRQGQFNNYLSAVIYVNGKESPIKAQTLTKDISSSNNVFTRGLNGISYLNNITKTLADDTCVWRPVLQLKKL